MGRYILRRLLISIPVLFGITVVVYLLINLAPGDPITSLIDPGQAVVAGPEWVEAREKELGLDEPLLVRYGIWLREVLQGNFGYSFQDRQPVGEMIQDRLWPTVKLMLAAETIAIVIGIPIGVMSALKQYSIVDYLATIFAFGSSSIPSFFLALGAIYIFSVQLGWLPTAGTSSVGGTSSFLDSLHHLILPATILGLATAPPLVRYARSSVLEAMRQDYVQTARSKGLRERVVIWGHVFRNAAIPLVTIIALDLPALFSGTVIIEQIFSWPGMGSLVITAVRQHDYPIIMAINLMGAVLIIVSNLLADVAYAVIDPRIRYG